MKLLMKFSLFIAMLCLLIFSCKNTQKATNNTISNYWTALNKTAVPKKYQQFNVFTLDEVAFKKALENGNVIIPSDEGQLNSFDIESANTMSEELSQKFPDIKSYKGVQKDNSLCKPRININKTKVKISVFCNDKTYFIDKDKELNIFIVYNKQSAPKGIGVVNE